MLVVIGTRSVGADRGRETDGVHQGSVLPPIVFTVIIDVSTEKGKQGLMYRTLCAVGLVLMSETVAGLGAPFMSWMWVLRSKGLIVSFSNEE